MAQPWSDYGASEDPAWPFNRVTLATFGQVGAIWGTSYIRNGNMMLASPVVKRMSGLGGAGGTRALGNIYRVNNVLNPDGTLNPRPRPRRCGSTCRTSTWSTRRQQGRPRHDRRPTPPGGLGDHNTPAKDLDGFTKSAEVGIGGMATSLDGRAMFIANLHDKSIYGIPLPLDDPDATPTYAVKIPTPVGANQQLWALSTYRGRLYLGYVDTGSRPGQSASSAGLKAYVVSIPLEDAVDSVVRGSAGRRRLASRDHRRPGVRQGLQHGELADPGRQPEQPRPTCINGQPSAGSPSMDASFPQLNRWNTLDQQLVLELRGRRSRHRRPVRQRRPEPAAARSACRAAAATARAGSRSYAQPVLSGITFDIDGYMILGFTDRSAMQSGNRNFAAVSSPTSGRYWESISNGDTLIAAPSALVDRACRPAARARPVRTSCWSARARSESRPQRTAAAGTPSQNPTYSNSEGPGGGEFLNDRRDQGTGGNHNENTLGSVVTYPGVDEIAASAMDPYSGINRNGLMWFDQNTGVATRGFDQVVGDQDNQSSTFQKGGGLGSIALLGVAAPVEIGNRVWLDADLNGRQDPDEPAINGAPVQLWTADPASTGHTGVQDRRDRDGDRSTVSPAPTTSAPTTRRCRTSPARGMTPSASSPTPTTCVVFPPGSGLVQFRGPNAAPSRVHRSDLGPNSSARPSRCRSRPPPATAARTPSTTPTRTCPPDGRPSRSADPGENDHTIDAGWYGVAPLQVEKTVTGQAPPGQKYTVTVTGATNFRGDDRLTTAGTDPGGRDPKVAKTSYVLTPGTPVASGQNLPYGYELTLKETDPDLPPDAVTYKPADPDNPEQARVIIGPRLHGAPITLDVTNAYGAFQVVKIAGRRRSSRGRVRRPRVHRELDIGPSGQRRRRRHPARSRSRATRSPQPTPALWFPVGTKVTLSEVDPDQPAARGEVDRRDLDGRPAERDRQR